MKVEEALTTGAVLFFVPALAALMLFLFWMEGPNRYHSSGAQFFDKTCMVKVEDLEDEEVMAWCRGLNPEYIMILE